MKTAIVFLSIFFAAGTACAQNDQQQGQVYVDAQYADQNYQQQGYDQQQAQPGYEQQTYDQQGYDQGQAYYDDGSQAQYGAQGGSTAGLQALMQNYFGQMDQKLNALQQQQTQILENQKKTFEELEVLKMRIRRS